MMNIYPETFYTDIEFDQILDMAAEMAKGKNARNLILQSTPLTDFSLWRTELEMVHKLAMLKRNSISFNLGEYKDIHDPIDRLKIKNYTLDLEEVLEIHHVLALITGLHKWTKHKEIINTSLYVDYLSHIHPFIFKFKQELDGLFHPDGRVNENATPTLKKLHSQLARQEKQISSSFQQVLQKYKGRNLLAEPYESYKNGKQVLCVAAENKRNIKGLIQDESGTGQTVYIEPDEMMPLYHALYEIRSDIRQEIHRLIRKVSADLRAHRFQLQEAFIILTAYDVWNAKAAMGVKVEGYMPVLQEQPIIQWHQSYHPLLKIRHEGTGKSVIPFDLELSDPESLILVSGPNAGGKSVLLKAVALNQIMLQCGFLIPVDPRSKSGMFHGFFADIGDQQSLEEDLSTYSSHLQNMRMFLKKSNHRSLVFIDEMGSGTDPQYGGAISEAVLDQLVKKKVWGVITTHYFNLKMYADKCPRIGNGAMSFDRKNLEPTYRFIPGKPGSSFAFEIAKKTGLSDQIIRYARNKSGKNKWAIEEMLVNLENEKNELQKKERALEETKKQLNQLLNSNKVLSDELAFQRKKWKMTRKQDEFQRKAKDEKWLRSKIRELESREALHQARKLESDVKKEKEVISREIKSLDRSIVDMERIPKGFFRDLKVGDYVRYKDGDVTGKVLSINKNKAELQVGGIRMNVNKKDLRPGKEPLPIQKGKKVDLDIRKQKSHVQHKIDIRGYSMIEAEKELQHFLDEATMANISELRILHGKGSGVLRNLVREKLREYNHVRDVSHPPREQGGDGVTLVQF